MGGASADDLFAHKSTCLEAWLDADNAENLLFDGARAGPLVDGHDAGNTIGQVVDVLGRARASVTVTTLTPNQ